MDKTKITGITGTRLAKVCASEIQNNKGRTMIVTANLDKAKILASDLSFFVNTKNIYLLDTREDVLPLYDAQNKDMMHQKMKILQNVYEDKECILITDIANATYKLPPQQIYSQHILNLKIGDDIDLKQISQTLVSMGYERVSNVYAKCQFAIRGSILDVFAVGEVLPHRIDLFDTEIETIKTFDIDTQRSKEGKGKVSIYPASSLICEDEVLKKAMTNIENRYKNYPNLKNNLLTGLKYLENPQKLGFFVDHVYDKTENIYDYMQAPLLILDDDIRISESIDVDMLEYTENFKLLLEKEKVIKEDFGNYNLHKDYEKLLRSDNLIVCTPFDANKEDKNIYENIVNIKVIEPLKCMAKMDVFAKEIRKYVLKKYIINIILSTKERIETVRDLLERENIIGNITFCEGSVSIGMEFPERKEVFLTDIEIFGNAKLRRRKRLKFKDAQPIDSFTDIKAGDYVVHEIHGIGQFLGIKQLEVSGNKKDYIHIQYAGQDALYVPTENMNFVQKYIGNIAKAPKISKLSSNEWNNIKARAKASIEEMAKELIETSAKRKSSPGYKFEKDTVWQKEFEEAFVYQETDDQLKAIEEIKEDMEKPICMDRLLCGDVGFGKTEVAARAMFKAAIEGKQVAMLVPTTILADQHYKTLKQRFEKFPFEIEMVSRFKTAKEQEYIIDKINEGKIDIVIGTHRLLSDDVKFKDLGLLVIDEEQRFGVTHKEKIKKLKANVDLLSLSATPIPRTLHMSLIGLKNISIIAQPPEDRLPVQTYVVEEDDHIIREVIERECARDGQVFIVFNRVRGIQRFANRIKELVPDKEILVAHGQMKEEELEDVMIRFINQEAEILIATTIIEAGIDIPNANSQIIIDADKFGLSQLYQLRGRVGRSGKLAYAYLMHKKNKALTEISAKRLQTIKEFTEFGSGFKIAMRDLEFRGAGSLLGTQQHGHMADIGYELYCKLVNEAVDRLNGKEVAESREEIKIILAIEGYIPDEYIDDEATKMMVYKQIANISNMQQAMSVREEIADRFGKIPNELENLIKVAIVKYMCEDIGINKIMERNDKIVFVSSQKGVRPIEVKKRKEYFILDDIIEFLQNFV